MTCVSSEDSDQPRHPPSLIIVFAVRTKLVWAFDYLLSVQRTLWSDWVDAQADLSLRWAHRSVCWFCHEAAQITRTEIWMEIKCRNDASCAASFCMWFMSWTRFGMGGNKEVLSHTESSDLLNGPRQANFVLIAYASSEGSGEPAHPRSLARTSAARSYKHWVKRNLQTESHIPGLSEWLGMRS